MKKRIKSFNKVFRNKKKKNLFITKTIKSKVFLIPSFVILLLIISSFSYYFGAKNSFNLDDALTGEARKFPKAYDEDRVKKNSASSIEPTELYVEAVSPIEYRPVTKESLAFLSSYESLGNLNPFPTKSSQSYLQLKIFGMVDSAEVNLTDFYLYGGSQTQLTKVVKDEANKISDGKNNLETVKNIMAHLQFVNKNECTSNEKTKLGYNYEKQKYDSEFKRKRTAEQIIKSKCFTGCTDYTLVFVALAREKGIPATITETFREKWLENNVINGWTEFKQGHFFSEVYLVDESKWIVVDPTANVLTGKDFEGYFTGPNPDKNENGISIGYVFTNKGLSGVKYLLFERGLDPWDYGIKDIEELDQALKKKYFIKDKIDVK